MGISFGCIDGSAWFRQPVLHKPVSYCVVDVQKDIPGFKCSYLVILLFRIDPGFNVIHCVILLVCSGQSFSGGNGEIRGSGATLGAGLVVGFTSGLTVTAMSHLLCVFSLFAQKSKI